MATRLFTGTVRLLCKPTFGRQWHHCYCRGTIMLIKNTRAAGAIAARPRFLRSASSSWSVSTSGKYQYHTSNARPSSNAASGPLNLGSDHLIESWFHEVKTFGSLTVNDVPFDVHIQPLNPMEYPIANKSIVQMFYDVRQAPGGEGPLPGQKLSDMSKVYDLTVLVDDGGNNMDVKCDLPAGVQLPVVCVITVPLKFDLRVKGRRGRDVTISSMENANVDVHLEKGNCHIHSLKSGTVNVKCDSGNITCKRPLLGNVNMTCGADGCIEADRFQGTTVDCSTDGGDINVNMLYAQQSCFESSSGNLRVGGCHGNVTVKSEEGNLTIDSLDGALSAELCAGSADVFVARQDGVNITSKEGDITLRFSQDYSCSLDLEARSVETDKSLSLALNDKGKGFLKSESETKVKATAHAGKISVKAQDWLASLKLQFGSST